MALGSKELKWFKESDLKNGFDIDNFVVTPLLEPGKVWVLVKLFHQEAAWADHFCKFWKWREPLD